jgi:hypothetical protein
MIRAWVTALAVLVALPASAQQLALDIRDGLVTMQATNVPVRQVLAEWARVGGTRVVGADRLTGPPVTLQFEGMAEAKALDILLRGAAGYVAAPRVVQGSGRSAYDRILVLASSTPPAGGAAPAQPAGFAGRAPNRFGTPPAEQPEPSVPDDTPVEQPQVNPFANAFGQPGMAQPFGQPAANPFGQPPQNPFGQPVANPFGQPLGAQPGVGNNLFVPVTQPPTAPAGGFGTFGSAVPGMVQPAQPVDAQGRPRPPGGR